MTNLSDSQKQTIAAWMAEGLKLSEIQTRLNAEFGLSLTYMEVRLLMDDLRLMPKDPPPQEPAVLPAAKGAGPASAPAGTPGDEEPPLEDLEELPEAPGKASRVSVTVDQLARPGAIVSGSVTFSDGQVAQWYLDQTGRLGLAPKQQGYRPPPADIQDFQAALERELRRMGL